MPVAAAATAVVAGTVYQVDRGQAASRAQKRASERQIQASKVSGAQKERERQLAVRKQQREERIRRARVLSAAEVSGVSGSSVATSTIGSGQTIAAAGTAFATGANLANQQISSLSQQAANLQSQASYDLARGQIGSAVAGLGMAGISVFGPSASGGGEGT
tara:strand:- start:607 stop:1089 length:483 start_codon:yes stop_codon:yes gene_type:complete